jgi:hypothetical protein
LKTLLVLREIGPALGRPRVDAVKGSAYPNKKFYETMIDRADALYRRHIEHKRKSDEKKTKKKR